MCCVTIQYVNHQDVYESRQIINIQMKRKAI